MEKHINGTLESIKFDSRRKDFYEYRDFLDKQEIPIADLLEHFPAYVGHMSLNRLFSLYELYKMTQNVAGHIAEIGVYKGSGSLLFAKLVHIFENEALTQVHGFDQFSHELGSGETIAVRELLPNAKIKTIPNSWMPNAYIIKE